MTRNSTERRVPTSDWGQVALMAPLAASFGVIFLTRFATGYLGPAINAELNVGPRELGLLSAAFAAAWSLSGWLVPSRLGHRVSNLSWLGAPLAAIALSCIGTGYAGGLVSLLLLRLLAGAGGGPALPFIQSLVASRLSERRRGLHMGLIQGIGGGLIASMLGPILLARADLVGGWRGAMVLLGIVAGAFAAYCALAPGMNVPTPGVANDDCHAELTASRSRIPRNVWICAAIGSLMLGWLVINTTFYPLYMSKVLRLDSHQVGWIMSLNGAGSLIGMIAIPWMSDFIGRRRALFLAASLGALAPLALLVSRQYGLQLAVMMFAGSLAGGSFPLFLAVIPSEAVAPGDIARGVGTVQAIAEIAGGTIAPAALGLLAGEYGMAVPVVAGVLVCPVAAFAALLLRDHVLNKSA